MRQVLYKKRNSNKYHRKLFCINEHNEDKECKTQVRKSFIYKVASSMSTAQDGGAPEIYITKMFDSKLKQEKFCFRVRGHFYMNQDGGLYKVDFCHALKIDICWKDKTFSPNKSATLT